MVKINKQYPLFVVLAFVVLWVFSLTLYWTAQYREMEGSHRITNLRTVPPDLRRLVLSMFLDEKAPSNDARRILLLGDSQLYGWNLPHPFEPARILQEMLPNHQIINLSVPDTYPDEFESILRLLLERGEHFDVLVHNATVEYAAGSPNLEALLPEPSVGLFLEFIAVSPKLLFDHLLDHNRFTAASQGFTYFSQPKDRFKVAFEPRDTLTTAYQLMAKLADKVIIYKTPNAVFSFEYYGFSSDNYDFISIELLQFCKSMNHVCMLFDLKFGQDDFLDIIHFSKQGLCKWATIIAGGIEGQAQQRLEGGLCKGLDQGINSAVGTPGSK